MKIILILFINLFMTNFALASDGYEYNFIEKPNQKIHLVKIDLNNYDISLVSAHNKVFGRETVGDIAKREDAFIAINAGFFQIGNNEDGRPTGTLIVNGKLFGLRTTKHAVFAIRNQIPSIEIWQPNIEVKFQDTKFTPKKFNKFANNPGMVLYSDKWASHTVTPYKTRNEIVISPDMLVTNVSTHGNNIIPHNGYVLSLPKKVDISSIKSNDSVIFANDEYSIFDDKTSAIMGIPFLIMNGKMNEKLSDSEKHARTAIGIDKNGKIIIAVVECIYAKSINSLTLKETNDIFQKNNIALNDLTVKDVKKLLMKELSHNSSAAGMTTKELANFMQELACVSAINLDGGGSSSLYIDGNYINHSVGDKDEAEGLSQVRPVSDAIIFKKK